MARPRNSDWTVQQIVAHVLTVAHRYRNIAQDKPWRRAEKPAELADINQAELEAVMAPVPKLADEIEALAPEIHSFFDTIDDQRRFVGHAHAVLDGISGQTSWLGELLVHGHDVARAVKAPWELPERDMLLVLRAGMQYVPAMLRDGITSATRCSVALKIPGARPYLIHIHDGIAETRPLRPDDRPDAVIRTPASPLALLLYGRIGPFTAARRGLRVVSGRRPWVALKLGSYFETP